jgi:hypothetical protein
MSDNELLININNKLIKIEKTLDELQKKIDNTDNKINIFYTFVDYLNWVKIVTFDALKTSNVTYITDWLNINLHRDLIDN